MQVSTEQKFDIIVRTTVPRRGLKAAEWKEGPCCVNSMAAVQFQVNKRHECLKT